MNRKIHDHFEAPDSPPAQAPRPKPFTPEEFAAYKARVEGETPLPAAAMATMPSGPQFERAKALLDSWHARNIATIEGLEAEVAAVKPRWRLMTEPPSHSRPVLIASLATSGLRPRYYLGSYTLRRGWIFHNLTDEKYRWTELPEAPRS